jgi:hypothetical protein
MLYLRDYAAICGWCAYNRYEPGIRHLTTANMSHWRQRRASMAKSVVYCHTAVDKRLIVHGAVADKATIKQAARQRLRDGEKNNYTKLCCDVAVWQTSAAEMTVRGATPP